MVKKLQVLISNTMSGFNNIIQRGKPLVIKDDGIIIASDIGSIDFVGDIVSGSVVGENVTETFVGSSDTVVKGETVSFSGTSGTLANTPTSGSLALYRGGTRQQEGIGNDYTISGAVITLAVAASAGEIFLADYSY